VLLRWKSYCTCDTHEILLSLGNAVSTGLQNHVELESLKLDSSPSTPKEFSSLVLTVLYREQLAKDYTLLWHCCSWSLHHLHLLSKAEEG